MENESKQENVRGLAKENLELIKEINRITLDNYSNINGNINAKECEKVEESNADDGKNIIDLELRQRDILKDILNTLEETNIKLVG